MELIGHESMESAYLVDDYPYGFRLRCKIRYWIETTKHGQRLCSQTSNPKQAGLVWNKPKKGTYSDLIALYLDEQGHVQHAGLSIQYSGEPERSSFLERFPLTCQLERALKEMRHFRAILKARSVISFTCSIGPDTRTEQEKKEQEIKEKEILRAAINYGYATTK